MEGCQGVEDFLVLCSNLSKVIFVASILSMVIEDFLVSCSNTELGGDFDTGSILGMVIEAFLVSCLIFSKGLIVWWV